MPVLTRLRAAVLAGGLLALLLVLATHLLRPRSTATRTFYASPTGTGTACTQAAPCLPGSWWPLAGPGATLVLLDGVYTGALGMLAPPAGLAGTPTAPITLKAFHDGQVLLDAEHQRSALSLQPGNDWFVVEGMNAMRGKESLWFFGGSHNRGRRLIGWGGTEGQANSYIFSLGRQVDNVVEDCGGWGDFARKIFDGAQSQAPDSDSQWSGFRRCWGEFNGWPVGESNPTNTLQMGYRTRQQRFENLVLTWNTLGATGNPDGVVSFFYDCEAASNSVHGTALLGSLLYLLPGQRFDAASLATATCTSDAAWREVVFALPPGFPGTYPFSAINQTSVAPQGNNRCETCVSVYGDGNPARIQNQTGWTMPGFREARTLAEALDGQSVYTLLPSLCYRVESGVLTNKPLWSDGGRWPMNSRIMAAREASGYGRTDVTQDVIDLLGPIPAECKSTTPVPPDPGPGPAAMTCSGDLLAAGRIELRCSPATRKR